MKSRKLFLASIVAAVAASLCCILPIAFAILGVSVVGASAAFTAWRPYLLGITGLLLAAGFYFAYRPRKGECAAGETCAIPSTQRRSRTTLWIGTALVIAFVAFPEYSGPVARWLLPGGRAAAAPATAAGKLAEAKLAIQGMDCPACAVAITHNLQNTPGVVSARVLYSSGRAVVRYRAGAVSTRQLVQAVAAAGYRSHPM
jgi:mercuric ion transport protein